jgi:phosphatidylglycerol:prolipoprotein diacylglycerol transferase
MVHGETIIAVLRIDIDPFIHLGPVNIAWHGLMSAIGILVGLAIAVRYAKRKELDPDHLHSLVVWMMVAGIVGARLLFLLENDISYLLDPGAWFGSQGFSIYGAIIGAGLAAGALVIRRGLSLWYLDSIAAGFPLGMAIGRIGDLINGEHYGAASNLPWAIQYVHPAADVPSANVAYHAGGLYEVALALGIAVTIWLIRDHFRRPTELLWTVVGLYGAGRFVMFFYRVDSEPFLLGLDTSQWISLTLLVIAILGLWVARNPTSRRHVAPIVVAILLLGGGLGSLAGCASSKAASISRPGSIGTGTAVAFQPAGLDITTPPKQLNPCGHLRRDQIRSPMSYNL